MRLSTLALALAFALVSATAWTQPDADAVRGSVVQVAVMRGGEVERLGSGFVVASGGYVVTVAHLVADESSIAVVPLVTGTELVARVSYINERSGLALLAVNGLESPPLSLAADGFGAGQRVYSAGVWPVAGEPTSVAGAEAPVAVALGTGSVGRQRDLPGASAVPLLEHNAMIPAAGYGGPLLNECGEVAGLNRGAPGASRRQLRRGRAPDGVVHALRAPAVASLLQAQGIAVQQSDAPCVGALAAAQAEAEAKDQQLAEATGQAEATREQIEQEREQAAARAAEAQARVSDLEAQYEEAVRSGDEQAEALRTELEAARGEREEAQTAISALEDEVSALQQRQVENAAEERQRLIAVGVGAGVLVLALGVALAMVWRRRKNQVAQAEAEAAQADAAAAQARQEAQAAREAAAQRAAPAHPDCLLTGRTGDERPVSVKIPGSLLGGDGAIIGRSPRNSTLLIDDETLSREHARLFAKDGVLHLEDLGSTNGTRLNGRDLDARTAARVNAGDAIEFGAVRVALSVSA